MVFSIRNWIDFAQDWDNWNSLVDAALNIIHVVQFFELDTTWKRKISKYG